MIGSLNVLFNTAPSPCAFATAPENDVSTLASVCPPASTTRTCCLVPWAYAEKTASPGNGDCACAVPGVKAATNAPTVSTASANAVTRALTRVLLLPIGPLGYGCRRAPPYLYLRLSRR